MSANSQEIPLSIECFMDDKDVAGKMGRETLEKLAVPLLRKIEDLMRSVLDAASESLAKFSFWCLQRVLVTLKRNQYFFEF